ncbi:reverse transcriptase domain-containing protein [Tanacetum coccineum]
MRTRSSSNLIVESSTILKRRNRRRSKQIVEPKIRTILETPVVTMADTRTMSELLQAPTEGYGDTIVIPVILAENFDLKVGLLQLGAARIWLEKEPPRSILTWEDLVSKFVNYFFLIEGLRILKNDIPIIQKKFEETFSEACDRFKELLHSLNAAAGGNLLNRTPRDALTIIENKSKVRTSRNKPIVSKVSTTTSSSSPSPDVTALTEMVKELVLMNKANQQASVKAVDEICVTCGGPHPYYECLATDSNTFNAYAATGTYNQGGNGYRPQGDPNYRASNQMGPPGFPPPNVQNNQNYNRYNQNQGNYQAPNNQGRGQNFNQGNNNYQAPNFQAPNYQAQVGPSNELTNYMKSNEATLRAMQTQMTNMKTELRNEFKSSLDTRTNKIENQNNQIMNILNLIGDVKAITTRSGVAYDGPTIPPTPSPLPKEVERETDATKDKVQTISSESTAHVQPLIVQIPISEPEVAPKTNPKPSIPYPLRLNDQKLHEKSNNQMLKFLQIFQILHFDISFADALLHMPKFASTFKSLLSNPEKLFELPNTPLNENYECLALADLGASINLMPLSVWKKLSLLELTPTCMTLELADRSVAHPKGVAEDVFVKVGKIYFLDDFVVVDYDVDPRVPLILGRPFLRTARALIDVHGEELTLRVNDEAITMLKKCSDYSDSSTSGNPTPSDPIIAFSSPSFTPFEGGDFILEEIEACLSSDSIPSGIDDADFDPEGDIRLLEKLLNK